MFKRTLGRSGIEVNALGLGCMEIGGKMKDNESFPSLKENQPMFSLGDVDDNESIRTIHFALEAGVNFFDTAPAYGAGHSERVLGRALSGRRAKAIIATKFGKLIDEADNQFGRYKSARELINNIRKECEDSLRRLKTDHIDVYFMHGFDALTPVDETLRALDDLVSSGKVRYLGCSNFSGWHLMKSLAASDKYGWARYVAHQAYYSLVGRDFEWELMPLGHDQHVGTIVWSPLGWGRLTGKLRRNQPPPAVSRLPKTARMGPPVPDELLYRVIDAIDEVAKDTGKTVTQIALNWLMQKPTIASVIVGARNEEQLTLNLGALGWSLTKEQVAVLDRASEVPVAYPYWHQRQAAPDRILLPQT